MKSTEGTRGFVDTHIHWWDRSNAALRYSWLDPDAVNPELGRLDAIKAPKYDYAAFHGETRFSGLAKAVHVAAAKGSADPVLEDDWLESEAERHGMPHAIVASAGLADPGAQETLERHAAHPRVRGIRDLDAVQRANDPAFLSGFGLLSRHGLLFELDAGWQGFAAGAQLAERFPQTWIVLDHGGFRRSSAPDDFERWSAALRAFGCHENVVCKISGLSLIGADWTLEVVRPWILTAIECFGSDRCFFGSNWPVDRLWCSYDALIDTYRSVISDFSVDEQESLLRRNAERCYRI